LISNSEPYNFLKNRRAFTSNLLKKQRSLRTQVSTVAATLPIQVVIPSDPSTLMRFLFRMIFWLTVVLVLLPSVGSQTSSNGLVSAGDAVSAAKATVTDVRSFCERQPEACVIGSQAATALGHRAQAGARMLYDYLTEHFGESERVATPNPAAPRASPHTAGRAARDTLVATDLVPAWRGPRS
jgi:hypothetical protein